MIPQAEDSDVESEHMRYIYYFDDQVRYLMMFHLLEPMSRKRPAGCCDQESCCHNESGGMTSWLFTGIRSSLPLTFSVSTPSSLSPSRPPCVITLMPNSYGDTPSDDE